MWTTKLQLNTKKLLTVEHREITMDKCICYETIYFFLIESVTLTSKTIVKCSFSLSFGKYQNFSFNRTYMLKVFSFLVPVLFAQVPKALSGPAIWLLRCFGAVPEQAAAAASCWRYSQRASTCFRKVCLQGDLLGTHFWLRHSYNTLAGKSQHFANGKTPLVPKKGFFSKV